MREAGQADEQRGPYLLAGEGFADADGTRHQRLSLEGGDLVRLERGVDRGTEAGVEAVDSAIPRGGPIDDLARPLESADRDLREAHPSAVPRYGDNIGDRDGSPADLDQRSTPLLLRKA